jgi:hypothetical protein
MLAAARANLERALAQAREVLTSDQWSRLPDAFKLLERATND